MSTTDEIEVWDLGGWDAAAAFVQREFPEARHVGVGYWKIPRRAELVYFCGTVRYIPRGADSAAAARMASALIGGH